MSVSYQSNGRKRTRIESGKEDTLSEVQSGVERHAAPSQRKEKRTRGKCKRGERKLERTRCRADQFQEAHYNSEVEDEVPGDETLEQAFSCAQALAADDHSLLTENQCFPDVASQFVAAVALACRNVVESSASDASNMITQLFSKLQGLRAEEWLSEEESLENLSLRCIKAEETATCQDFVYIVNCIQLRCMVVW
jgi:hypothetical protein